MKFPDLPIGAQFRWRGAEYTKTGPLTARQQGASRDCMIARSTVVATVEVSRADGHAATQGLQPRVILAALDDLLAGLDDAIRDLPNAQTQRLREALDGGRRDFLRQAGLSESDPDERKTR